MHMSACVAGEWGTAHITGHDLSLDLCADHILWHHIVCPMDGDRPPAGRQSAGSWQCNVDGLTADGLTGCMLLCNAPAVTTPTQGSDLWRGTVSQCHSLFMQDPTCYTTPCSAEGVPTDASIGWKSLQRSAISRSGAAGKHPVRDVLRP